ncbi:MAG: 4-(cytidine 5'-diphospho)-2-C-methyl-D-erythritol kinase [Bacteroidales bacterium]|nr:4-(cytidine 5'-diphospho)-2-C-methyl-D-erythritol kinase [Candidatus Cryptobacteroides faecihippi]
MILKTNVKINLGLNVLRKREDGFHDLETLFLPCFEYGDSLEVITGDDYSRTSAALFARYSDDQVAQGISEDGKLMITIAREEGVDWEPLKDLCAKAYALLAKDFDLPAVKIFLEKKAPVGAGLGGGSADAAFTLRALNELCGLGLSDEALALYASKLGSDCAFFIFNRPMLGSGRGEILEPVDFDLEALGLQLQVLVPEGIAVSTAEAYRGVTPKEPSIRIREVLARPSSEWKELLVNDFEASVFPEHKELAAIKQSLYDSGAVYAAMSGSGSALFGLYQL